MSYTRLLHKPLAGPTFLLLGPRCTGKTYWLRTHLSEAVRIDLLDATHYLHLLPDPSRLVEYLPAEYKGWVVIHEIQRIPDLLNEVHRLIEERGIRFALTGSSARKLRKQGVNLLAGRVHIYHMYPLTVQELGEEVAWEKILRYGLLPPAVQADDPEAFLKSYVHTYLREEVLQEGLTRNLSAFSRFLEVASLSQGQVLNKSTIACEVGVGVKQISNYLDILEDLLLAYTLPVFKHRAKWQILHHPKFYFFDTGVFQSLRTHGPLDTLEEIQGAALETLFLQSLHAINGLQELGYSLHYWRTLAGLEVDFVCYGNRGFLAFEVKHSHSIRAADLKSLQAFLEAYPMAKAYLIYGGDQLLYKRGITLMPFKQALMELPKLLTQAD